VEFYHHHHHHHMFLPIIFFYFLFFPSPTFSLQIFFIEHPFCFLRSGKENSGALARDNQKEEQAPVVES
jgi:hypothetical protein